jgi:hypothetical protein
LLYVAVAKAPNQWNHGYLSDCIVYEISRDGHVAGMANLPRMVHGRQHVTIPGGLLWRCEKGAMVMLAPEMDGTGFFGMPGGPDMISRVAWYRQFPKPESKGWLTADKVRDVVAFDSTHAYRAVAGGYVARKEEKIYRFPLSIVDLASGVEHSATLVVPYKGELKLPTQNVSQTADSTHADGPYLLGVTQLHVDRNGLEVTIGMEGTSAGVSFDLKAAGLAE